MENLSKEVLISRERQTFPIRIVVDLNVIIEGIFYRSDAVETIFDLLQEGTCALVYTKSIQREFEAVAEHLKIGRGKKAKLMEKKDRYFVRELFKNGIRVKEDNLPPPKLPTDDPTDAKFVVAARKGNCSCIISYDYDLLVLPKYRGFQDITVLTPEEFLKKFGFTP